MLKGLCHGWLVYVVWKPVRLTSFQKLHPFQSTVLQVRPSTPPFVFAMLFILSFNVSSGYFYVSLSVVAVIPLFEF